MQELRYIFIDGDEHLFYFPKLFADIWTAQRNLFEMRTGAHSLQNFNQIEFLRMEHNFNGIQSVDSFMTLFVWQRLPNQIETIGMFKRTEINLSVSIISNRELLFFLPLECPIMWIYWSLLRCSVHSRKLNLLRFTANER